MRMILKLHSAERRFIDLPQHYNHLVQAAIYKSISPSLSHFLHDAGFTFGRRRFKLFTFSRLSGRHRREAGRIIFGGDLYLQISSPIDRFIKDLADHIVNHGFLTIGSNKLRVTEVRFPPEPEFSREVRIKALSPITMYSTLYTKEGVKKTYYYSPYEEEFSRLLDENSKKKLYILSGKKIKSSMETIPLSVKECVVMYKDTVVKGWYGIFSLKGPISLIRIVYEAGLGAKNSEGFGMFEVMSHV